MTLHCYNYIRKNARSIDSLYDMISTRNLIDLCVFGRVEFTEIADFNLELISLIDVINFRRCYN